MVLIHIAIALQSMVSGTVMADGAAVANAKVQFMAAGHTYDATTTADGQFTAEVEDGTYAVTVERKVKRQIFTMVLPKLQVEGNTVLNLSWPVGTQEERDAALQAAFAKGSGELNAGSYDQAIGTFNDALKWDGAQSGVWASLALAYTGKADYKNAVYAAEMSIRFAPDNAGYRNNLGSILFRLGEYDRAAERYAQAAGLNEAGKGLYLSNQAACRVAQGRYADAKTLYGQACTDANVPPSSWYYLGAMCDKTGDQQGALSAYRSYLSSQPNGAYASQARARISALGG